MPIYPKIALITTKSLCTAASGLDFVEEIPGGISNILYIGIFCAQETKSYVLIIIPKILFLGGCGGGASLGFPKPKTIKNRPARFLMVGSVGQVTENYGCYSQIEAFRMFLVNVLLHPLICITVL